MAKGRIIRTVTRTIARPVINHRQKKAAGLKVSQIKSVLIVKPDHLGDLMVTAPAVAALKKYFSKASITLASNANGVKLFYDLGLIDHHLEYDGASMEREKGALFRQTRKIRQHSFDLVVNFRHDFRENMAVSFFKGKYYCTYEHKGTALFATHPAPVPSEEIYEVENHLDLVAELGVIKIPWTVPIANEAKDEIAKLLGNGKWVMMHPQARTFAKQWPMERFGELAGKINENGFGVVLVGGAEDSKVCEKLTREMDNGLNLAGQIDFPKLFALAEKTGLFVGVDSFVMHAAYAVGASGVAIFSGTNSDRRWAPPGFTVVKQEVECAPCALETCAVQGHPCLVQIDTQTVFEALLPYLKGGGA